MLERVVKRKHWIELEDQAWFPAFLRRYLQDYLQFMAGFTDRPLRTFANRLHWAMQACGETNLVDLCSGSGGPIQSITRLLKTQERFPVTAQLTDLYPHPAAMARREKADPSIKGVLQPVNATNVPEELKGFRLMCNSFHHFDRAGARRILGDAVEKGQGIAVLEMVSRTTPSLFFAWFGALTQFIFSPFVRPFSLGRLFFTYIIPVVPLATLWDGTVSCFRVYSPSEMEDLILPYRNTKFVWEIGKLPCGPGMKLNYLIGHPSKKL